MPSLSTNVVLVIGLTLVVGIGVISVTQIAAMQKGSNSSNNNNLLTAWAAEKKTVFLHQNPEANLKYNKTIHGYVSSTDGKIFKCNTFFDGVIYYKANDTNYFKCVDRGSTHGKNAEFQVVS